MLLLFFPERQQALDAEPPITQRMPTATWPSAAAECPVTTRSGNTPRPSSNPAINPDKLSHDALAAELTNHLVDGAVLIPGAAGTLPELQQAGFHYAK
jgi:hypothetical protein